MNLIWKTYPKVVKTGDTWTAFAVTRGNLGGGCTDRLAEYATRREAKAAAAAAADEMNRARFMTD